MLIARQTNYKIAMRGPMSGKILKDLKYFRFTIILWDTFLTLLRVPENNSVKGFLGSILTPTWALGSFLIPADALIPLGFKRLKMITRFVPLGNKVLIRF